MTEEERLIILKAFQESCEACTKVAKAVFGLLEKINEIKYYKPMKRRLTHGRRGNIKKFKLH